MNAQLQKLFVDDLHKQYGDNEVLKGVSLRAKAGDVISIIGSSGSGKSTMLRCINFLEQPNQGRIVVDGVEVRTRKDKTGALKVADPKQLREVRSKLSMVFQHFNLWSHMNVLENVTEAPVNVLGLSKKDAEDRARTYLEKVGLAPRMEKQYPSHLSGGQQQRVAIARALAMHPDVMLFTGYGGEDEESFARRCADDSRCSCGSRSKQRHAVRSPGRGDRIYVGRADWLRSGRPGHRQRTPFQGGKRRLGYQPVGHEGR